MSADLAPTGYLRPSLEEGEVDVQEFSARNYFFYNFNSRSLAFHVYPPPSRLLPLEEEGRDVRRDPLHGFILSLEFQLS